MDQAKSLELGDAYVAVPMTPTGAFAVDAEGIQLYEWSTPLKSPEDSCGSPVDFRYTAGHLRVLAQIESRLGIASYRSSYALLVVTSVGRAVAFWTWFVLLVCGNKLGVDGAPRLVVVFVLIAVQLGLTLWRAWRLTSTRTVLRTRFHIAGSTEDDRRVSFRHATLVVRQMDRHLKLDATVCASVPTA